MRRPDPRALSDAAAIVVFAIVGMVSHDRFGPSGFARDALPLLGAWFAVAAATGLYRRDGIRPLLLNWIIGVPLGVLVRAVALGRAFDRHEAAFLVTTLVFTLMFVAAGRAVLRVGRNGPSGFARRQTGADRR